MYRRVDTWWRSVWIASTENPRRQSELSIFWSRYVTLSSRNVCRWFSPHGADVTSTSALAAAGRRGRRSRRWVTSQRDLPLSSRLASRAVWSRVNMAALRFPFDGFLIPVAASFGRRGTNVSTFFGVLSTYGINDRSTRRRRREWLPYWSHVIYADFRRKLFLLRVSRRRRSPASEVWSQNFFDEKTASMTTFGTDGGRQLNDIGKASTSLFVAATRVEDGSPRQRFVGGRRRRWRRPAMTKWRWTSWTGRGGRRDDDWAGRHRRRRRRRLDWNTVYHGVNHRLQWQNRCLAGHTDTTAGPQRRQSSTATVMLIFLDVDEKFVFVRVDGRAFRHDNRQAVMQRKLAATKCDLCFRRQEMGIQQTQIRRLAVGDAVLIQKLKNATRARYTTKWKFCSNLLHVCVLLISRGLIVYLSARHMRRRRSARGGAVASAPACQSPYQEPAAQSKKAEPHYACHALFALFHDALLCVRSAMGCALAVLKMLGLCRAHQQLKSTQIIAK